MSESLWILLTMGIIALALRLAIFFFQKKKKQEGILPYKKRESLLTPTEKEFFVVLLEVVSDTYFIFPKVRMSDIVSIPKMRNKEYYHFFNKIQSKHVDFLICDKETIEPILAIELDDSSHQKPSRQSRDSLVNAIFESASLPILHIPTTHLYEKNVLSAEIGRALSPKETLESA
ncbi:MAG: DUF2726 domain-containing protein [Candidatus Moraniibacteriota bacterium]|nr:MAG: DUF2726 domain-containing protein [Candidatus Moranbacteria bacterium]